MYDFFKKQNTSNHFLVHVGSVKCEAGSSMELQLNSLLASRVLLDFTVLFPRRTWKFRSTGPKDCGLGLDPKPQNFTQLGASAESRDIPVILRGGGLAQSAESTTTCQESLGSIPAHDCLGRCQYNVTGWDRSHCLPALSMYGNT